MARETMPKDYPKLKDYKPSQFMLPTSHYDKAKADRAVKFIENHCRTKGKWEGKRFWLLPSVAASLFYIDIFHCLEYVNSNNFV